MISINNHVLSLILLISFGSLSAETNSVDKPNDGPILMAVYRLNSTRDVSPASFHIPTAKDFLHKSDPATVRNRFEAWGLDRRNFLPLPTHIRSH